MTGRSQAGLDSAQKELGNDAIVVSSDARSLKDIDALAAQVKAEFDTVDLLFVNAGSSIPTPLDSVTEIIYDEMFNLNAKGATQAGMFVVGRESSKSRLDQLYKQMTNRPDIQQKRLMSNLCNARPNRLMP